MIGRSYGKARTEPCYPVSLAPEIETMPTIALVDDDRNILTSVSIALENEGYRIQTYTDGATALDGLKQNPPDLAIFDIKMPPWTAWNCCGVCGRNPICR